MKKPYYSIIIVNWNGKKWLDNCLKSVFSQTCKEYEVILVDNGSSDDSIDFIKRKFPKTKIIKLDQNYGFAKANNIGIEKAKGEILFLLNNDTGIEKDMLEKVVPFFDDPKIGTVQPKIVLMNDKTKLDLVGAFWTNTTFLSYFGLKGDQNLTKYNLPIKVFSNKGAAMFVRKSMIDKIGGFDNDFWSYYEETDLCHRAWLSGYECWYYPVSTCYHANGGTALNLDNSYVQFHNFKNKLLSFLKNFETVNLLRFIPIYLFFITGLSVLYIVQGKFSKSITLIKSVVWNLANLKVTLQKRSRVQSFRNKSDLDYLNLVTSNISMKQVFKMLSL